MDPNNMETPEPKKKERKPVKPKTPQQVPLEQTNDQVAELIKDVLSIHLKKQMQRKKSQNEIEAMVSTCEEFMSSFIILGYDSQGNSVEPIVVAHNQQEADSLGAYLNKFINAQIQR